MLPAGMLAPYASLSGDISHPTLLINALLFTMITHSGAFCQPQLVFPHEFTYNDDTGSNGMKACRHHNDQGIKSTHGPFRCHAAFTVLPTGGIIS